MSQLQFCSLCNNLLKHQVKDGLKMQCHVCLNLEKVKNLTVYSETYHETETQDYPVHADLVLDKTLSRTLKMNCPNGECPSKKQAISPEVVIFHINSDYTQGYICTVCRSYWSFDQKPSKTKSGIEDSGKIPAESVASSGPSVDRAEIDSGKISVESVTTSGSNVDLSVASSGSNVDLSVASSGPRTDRSGIEDSGSNVDLSVASSGSRTDRPEIDSGPRTDRSGIIDSGSTESSENVSVSQPKPKPKILIKPKAQTKRDN
jgi:DNA-directed RNA polymerase subunit M/transcription elongation factor TFIIS